MAKSTHVPTSAQSEQTIPAASIPVDTLGFIHNDFHSALSCCIDTIESTGDVLDIVRKTAKRAIEGKPDDRLVALHEIDQLLKLCRWHGDDTWNYAATVVETFKEEHQAIIVSAARANHE